MVPCGWFLPEKDIQDLVNEGFADLRNGHFVEGTGINYLESAFFNFAPHERDEVRRWFLSREIKVTRNFPREEAELPSVVVLVQNENEEEYVGEHGYRFVGEESQHWTAAATRWTTTIGLMCVAANGDEATWLYQLVKFMVSHQRPHIARDYQEMHISGQDLTFDPRFLQGGQFLYRRLLVIRLVVDQQSVLESLSEPTLTLTQSAEPVAPSL